MERIADTVTLVIAFIAFAAMLLAMLVPWRRPDRLGFALCGVIGTLAISFGIGVLQLGDVLPLLLPSWERWAIRIFFDLFGIGMLAELIRGGAYRRPKGD